MKRCFFRPVSQRVYPVKSFDRWEMVNMPSRCFREIAVPVLGLVLELEMVEPTRSFLLSSLYFLRFLNRKDHTRPQTCGYRRNDIEPSRLENRDQEGHPNHDERVA